MYYIIFGGGSVFTLDEEGGIIERYMTGYFSGFKDSALFHIYSDDNKLEKVSGTYLNEAISLLGEGSFINLCPHSIGEIAIVRDLNIQTPLFGIYLHNELMIVAYEGYIYEMNNIEYITYIVLDSEMNLLIKTMYRYSGAFASRSETRDFVFNADGYVGKIGVTNLLGRYKGNNADVALCNYLL